MDLYPANESMYHDYMWQPWPLVLHDGYMALPLDVYEPGLMGDPATHTTSHYYLFRISLDKGYESLGDIPTLADYLNDEWSRAVFAGDTVYVVSTRHVTAANVADIQGTLRTVELSQ